VKIQGSFDSSLRGLARQYGHDLGELDLIKRAKRNQDSSCGVLLRNDEDRRRSSFVLTHLPVNPCDCFVSHKGAEYEEPLAYPVFLQMNAQVLHVEDQECNSGHTDA